MAIEDHAGYPLQCCTSPEGALSRSLSVHNAVPLGQGQL